MLRAFAVVTGLLLVAHAVPGKAAPCAGFVDVDDASPFCVSVTWIKNRGITLGCTATQYCPNDAVTRLQMAAFLYRLGHQNTFVQGGNAFGATAVLGTTDSQSLELQVGLARVVRYESFNDATNIIAGHRANVVNTSESGQTIAGGGSSGANANLTLGAFATVGGGFANRASALGTVAGGFQNAAESQAAVGGGVGNRASGIGSSVPGGNFNEARGTYSFAAGHRARTYDPVGLTHDGAFAWSDFNVNGFDFHTSAHNEFAARATGGVRFVTAIDGLGAPTRTVRINPNAELEFGTTTRQMLNLWGSATYGIGIQANTMYFRVDGSIPVNSGGYSWFKGGTHRDSGNDPGPDGVELMRLAGNGTLYVTGGAVAPLSDRAAKQDFAAIDPAAVLDKVTRLPLFAWAYKMNPSARHIGPSAQDFRAAFELGDDDKSIATVDADGVALAAIQGLSAKLEVSLSAQNARFAAKLVEKDAQIDSLRQEVDQLRASHAELAELNQILWGLRDMRGPVQAVAGPSSALVGRQ